MSARPKHLPPRTRLAVGFAGRLYPAWVERWARMVFFSGGPVSKAAPVVLEIDRPDFTAAINQLRLKLHRWGYANVTCHVKGSCHGNGRRRTTRRTKQPQT